MASPDLRNTYAPSFQSSLARDVKREIHVLTRPEARPADRLENDVERLAIGFEVRCEPAFVPDARGVTGLLEDRAERMKNLGARAKRFRERRQAHRHHHEFLQIDAAVGVSPAVEDIHHRRRQNVVCRGRPRQSAEARVERFPRGSGGHLCDGHRNTQERIRSETALDRRAIQFQ